VGDAVLSVDSIALLPDPAYPTHIEMVMMKVPDDPSMPVRQILNKQVYSVMKNNYADISLQGGDTVLDADTNVTFNYTLNKEPMVGEWCVLQHKQLALVLIGSANPEGWTATQLILREMASRVVWK
jgi:hypothetical protein